jgi:hypothetical protein
MSGVIYDVFFDFDQPCPDRITNCNQLRLEYKQEADAARAKGCTSCSESKIKIKYMEKIWNDYVASL